MDVDLPSTWKKYRNGMCENCWGGCCTMPVEVKIEDIIRLGLSSDDEAQGSHKKIANRLIREGIVKSYRVGTGLFTLEKKQGRDCYFLGKDRLCTVYERRPNVCRQFPSIGPRPGFCPQRLK